MYMARNLTFTEQNLDSDEFLDVVKLPFDEALRMVMDGTIKDSKTMIVIMKAWLLLNK